MKTQSQSDEKYVGPMILYQASTDRLQKECVQQTQIRENALHQLLFSPQYMILTNVIQ